MGKNLNLNRPSDEIILGYVNETNETELKLFDVSFRAPLSMPGDEYNSQVVVEATPESTLYRGTQTVNYTRLNLGTLFSDQVVLVTGGIEDHITAMTRVNAEYELQLLEGDLFAVDVDSAGVVNLRIMQHLVYLPNSQINVIDEFDYSLGVFDTLIHVSLADAGIPAD